METKGRNDSLPPLVVCDIADHGKDHGLGDAKTTADQQCSIRSRQVVDGYSIHDDSKVCPCLYRKTDGARKENLFPSKVVGNRSVDDTKESCYANVSNLVVYGFVRLFGRWNCREGNKRLTGNHGSKTFEDGDKGHCEVWS